MSHIPAQPDPTFLKHMEDDRAFQEEQVKVNEEAAKSRESIHKRLNELPTKEDIAMMATKEDIEGIKQFMNGVRVTTGFFSFTFENASKIGSFILFLGMLILIIKYGIMGAFLWLSKVGKI